MKIVYEKPDRSLVIVTPVDQSKSIDEIREIAEQKDPTDSLRGYRFVGYFEDDQIPVDREQRKNWCLNHDASEIVVKDSK